MVVAFTAKQEQQQNSFQAASDYQKTKGKKLTQKHYKHCCGNDIAKKQRGLNPEWIKANCYSADIKEASELLYYEAKSPGIIIVGQNGQYQFKPNKPWANKQGKKAPKYRTAYGDEYDALLPNHPTDPNFWSNLEELKKHCYIIDGRPYILITEGAFKAISAMIHGYATVALMGVEMGLTPKSADPQGKRYLVPSLEVLAKAGFGFILAFDADMYRNPAVKLALIKLAHQLKKFKVPVRCLPEWDETKGKGIDDYIQMNGIEEFREKLIAQAISWESWESKYGSETTEKGKKIPKADIIGVEFAEEYRQRWIYCDQYKNWLIYEEELPGVWELVSKDFIEHKIHFLLKARGIEGYGSNSYINNILGTMKRELIVRTWTKQNSAAFLPFKNGVLEIATGKFQDHSPDFRLTWQLPREYDPNDTDWSSISNWLDEAIQGNTMDKKRLLCFAAAVLRGRYDLQKFLHLMGDGGTGKSTFSSLLIALIGTENTVSLNIPQLEDKHEIARLLNKRLLVMSDQDKAGKRLTNFKSLTGQDFLSGRKLFENSFEFKFEGMAVITSNKTVFNSGLGSWLTRRTIMVPFDHKCPESQKRDLMKEFEPELSALTNYLLSIPISEIESVLKGLGSKSDLSGAVWESLMLSDGLTAWLNDHIIYDPEAFTRIGSNSHEWADLDEYDSSRSSLYGSYTLYCRSTNRTAKSLQNFSADLQEQCRRILGWDIEKVKKKIAGKSFRVILGLKLRNPQDNEPTIEDILSGDNPGDSLEPPKGDNLKPPPNKETKKGDNLILKTREKKNNFALICDNIETVTNLFRVEDIFATSPSISSTIINRAALEIKSDSYETVTDYKEVEKELSRNPSQVVPDSSTPINQEVEVVPQAVPQGGDQVVPPSVKADEEEKEVVLTTEDGDWRERDIDDIASLLSKPESREEFEKAVYNSNGEIWLPKQVLNLAAKRLTNERREQIKAWVLEIKNNLQSDNCSDWEIFRSEKQLNLFPESDCRF
ncbi:MAG: DUF3854 domain-containing protein [Prochloraceae cyanobacterium]|nr:DUF3854 domain-containing protein [Prochloraceae cyanobacterium]